MRSRRKRIAAWRPVIMGASALALAMALPSASAEAGSTGTSLSVTASVSNVCTISTTTLAFGVYDPVVTHAALNLDGTGVVTIACTKGAVVDVELGLGSNASGSQRRLKDAGTNFLNYQIYQNTGRTVVWGTGADTNSPGAAPSKTARDLTAYGRITSGQDVPAGSYSDTVTATVNY